MSRYVETEPQFKLAVLNELHRAFDRGLDGASERQRNLLSYLVTEELEGRGERLKAYSIATEVLGRPNNFDPQQDSIVRVEIGRLRQALERYYLIEGKDAPIVISIPKGQYRPVFTAAHPDAPEPARLAPPPAPAAPGKATRFAALAALVLVAAGLSVAAYWKFAATPTAQAPTFGRRGPVVAIAPFEIHADKEGQAFIAGGLQTDLADILSEYQWLTVIPLNDESALAPGPEAAIARPDFIVRGSLRLIADQLKATVLLLDASSGAVRWTNRYEMRLRAGDVMAMQSDLVARIGRDVGNPFGIVADIALAQRARAESRSDEALSCQLRAFHYWKTFKSADYAPAWRCFESIRARGPLDADSLAIGAILTLDPQNLRITNRSLPELRAEAAEMAARAFDLDSVDFVPRAARYATALCSGDIDAFRILARETAERFPNNPIALADIGARFILGSGDYAEGAALIERARAIAADLTPLDTIALAVDALRRGIHDDRPRLRRAAALTDSAIVLIVEMALAAARGDAEEAARVRGRLTDLGFSDQKRLAEALDSTCWSQNIRDLVKSRVTLALRDAQRD